MLKFIIYFVYLLITANCLEKPRGIPFSKLSFYRPNIPFKCIDGSGTIDWRKVNDDYCDCRDGTDEPGTSACHNGLFYCENKDFKPEYILSSRVNDGICDCCDGHDEYNGIINCTNTCWELGSIEREKIKRIKLAAEKGHEIFQSYIQEYENNIGDKKARLETISQEINTLNEEKLAAERVKNDAESTESEAKKTFEEEWKKLVAENETQNENLRMLKAFKELDIDNDGKISFEELQSHHEFDIDQNGDVTPEEAKEYLNEHEFVASDVFMETVWPNIKQIFRFKERKEVEIKSDDSNIAVPDVQDQFLEEEEKALESEPSSEKESESPKDEKPKMEYNEETKRLIEIADQARNTYNEINDKFSKLENEKRSIEDLLNIDYGPNSAYYHLAVEDTCFELLDREYIYKLCPFRRTVQSSNSGSDTDLGKWGRWSGNGDNLYSSQLYEQGATCWNGPSRQTKVEIACGAENKLLSASEPSRCEYLFQFETPAACDKKASEISSEFDHDEL